MEGAVMIPLTHCIICTRLLKIHYAPDNVSSLYAVDDLQHETLSKLFGLLVSTAVGSPYVPMPHQLCPSCLERNHQILSIFKQLETLNEHLKRLKAAVVADIKGSVDSRSKLEINEKVLSDLDRNNCMRLNICRSLDLITVIENTTVVNSPPEIEMEDHFEDSWEVTEPPEPCDSLNPSESDNPTLQNATINVQHIKNNISQLSTPNPEEEPGNTGTTELGCRKSLQRPSRDLALDSKTEPASSSSSSSLHKLKKLSVSIYRLPHSIPTSLEPVNVQDIAEVLGPHGPFIVLRRSDSDSSNTDSRSTPRKKRQYPYTPIRTIRCQLPNCPRKTPFMTQEELDVHILRVHEGISHPYVCKICNARFKEKYNKLEHIRVIHEGLKRYVCDVCGKGINGLTNLKEHMVVHAGTKDVLCPHCPLKFSTRKSWLSHQKRIHENRRNHSCHICGKCFAAAGKLKNHIGAMHERDDNAHVCQVCGKSFCIRKYLSYHIRAIHGVTLSGEVWVPLKQRTGGAEALNSSQEERGSVSLLNEFPGRSDNMSEFGVFS